MTSRPAVWAIFFGQITILDLYLGNQAVAQENWGCAAAYVALCLLTFLAIVSQINKLLSKG